MAIAITFKQGDWRLHGVQPPPKDTISQPERIRELVSSFQFTFNNLNFYQVIHYEPASSIYIRNENFILHEILVPPSPEEGE